MKETLNPTQVVRWLRDQGHELLRVADQVERTFSQVPPIGVRAENGAFSRIEIDPKVVRDAMRNRTVRIATLAKELGVDSGALAKIMTPENGFKRGTQGWFKLVD